METTNLGCAGHPHFDESIRDWLIANGADWNRMPAWPRILMAEDGKSFQVEQFYRNKNDRDELMRGLGVGVLTALKSYELQVPIDPDLWDAYVYSRPHALESAKREALKQLLQACPPAVTLNGGETLIFASRERVPGDVAAMGKLMLQEALPGVNVMFVVGVDSIMAGPGPISL